MVKANRLRSHGGEQIGKVESEGSVVLNLRVDIERDILRGGAEFAELVSPLGGVGGGMAKGTRGGRSLEETLHGRGGGREEGTPLLGSLEGG